MADLGNYLCKVDQGCKELLDFAQSLCSLQELNHQAQFYGGIPIAAVALLSLGNFRDGGSSSAASKKEQEQKDKKTSGRLFILEKQNKFQLNLDSRLEKLERLYT